MHFAKMRRLFHSKRSSPALRARLEKAHHYKLTRAMPRIRAYSRRRFG